MAYRPQTRMTLTELTLVPAVLTGNGGTSKATHVDGLDWASIVHRALIGNSADTLSGSLYWEVILQHSDDEVDGNFVDVTDEDLIEGTMVDAANGVIALINAPAEDQVEVEVEYRVAQPNAKRYSRLIFTRTGNHASGTPIGAIGTKHYPETPSADGY